MPINHKTKEVPQFSASERAVLVALVQRRAVAATGLAGATGLSLATTRRALRRFESLGAAVCVNRTTVDGQSVRPLWSASATVLDLLTSAGRLPMARSADQCRPTAYGSSAARALRSRQGSDSAWAPARTVDLGSRMGHCFVPQQRRSNAGSSGEARLCPAGREKGT